MSTYKEWEYSDTEILLGLYGRLQGTTIKQLGFITNDTDMEDCPIEASPTERVAEGLVLSDFDEEVN